MNRRPQMSAAAGADDLKIKLSQSKLKKLIKQEVRSAVSETKLQALIESIQQRENGVKIEKSIKKLEARINTLSKRTEAAIAYMTKTQKKHPVASLVNVDIIGVNPEDKNTETMPQIDAGKSGDLIEMMESTKTTLKKMHAQNMALTAAMADFEKEGLHASSNTPAENKELYSFVKTEPEENQFEEKVEHVSPSYCKSPLHTDRDMEQETTKRGLKRTRDALRAEMTNLTPYWNNACKEEPRDEQENVNCEEKQVEDPKSQKVKVECVSSSDTNRQTHTEQGKLLYPPLPPTTFPSVLNVKAASYNIPQRLEVNLALIRKPTSLSVLWKVEEEDPSAPPMDSYTIFLTMEKVKGSGVFPDWNILGEVRAMDLPMCVLVKKYKPGHKVCAAVVGKDIFGRYGPYSKVATAVIPE